MLKFIDTEKTDTTMTLCKTGKTVEVNQQDNKIDASTSHNDVVMEDVDPSPINSISISNLNVYQNKVLSIEKYVLPICLL